MRNEQMPWNKVRLTCEVVDTGVGKTGKTVNGLLYRISDGKWLQSGGGWNTSPSTLTLAAVDATNFPGLYAFAVSSGDHDYDAGLAGYYFVVTESTYVIREHGFITTTTHRNDIRDIDLSTPNTLTAHTLGDLVARMIELRGENVRVINTAWTNNVPTAGTLYLYASKAAHDSDTGPSWSGAYAKYDYTTTLDGSNNVTAYNSVRTS